MEAAVEKVGWCKEKNIGNAIQDREMKAQVGFKPTPSSTLTKNGSAANWHFQCHIPEIWHLQRRLALRFI